jgi:uncharacterized protein
VSLLALLLAALVGGAVGVVSGLLGIGGGVLMVPLLYILMGGSGWSGLAVAPDHEAALAHATSLFVIIFAALSGLRAFHREGAVSWRVVVPLGLAAVVAAFLASQVAAGLPSPMLKSLFGGFLLVSGVRLARARRRARRGPAAAGRVDGGDGRGLKGDEGGAGTPLRWWGALLGGGAVGFLSALLGVGGGIVAIPILIHFAGMGVHRVVPASIGIICFAAPAGVVGYVLAGQGVPDLPAGSLGFVHLPTALAMLPGAVLLAPVGARLNQRLPARTLEGVFAFLMVLLGAWLVWTNGAVLLGGSG